MSNNPCYFVRKGSSYALVFQSERIGTITANRFSVVPLNGASTFEIKGKRKQ